MARKGFLSILLLAMLCAAQVPDIYLKKSVAIDTLRFQHQFRPGEFDRLLPIGRNRYLLIGGTIGGNEYYPPTMVAVVDSEFNALWYKEYSPCHAVDLTMGIDSTIMLFGQAKDSVIALHLDRSGNVLNQYVVDTVITGFTTRAIEAYSISPLREGGYIVSYSVYAEQGMTYSAGFAKLDATGSPIWKKTYLKCVCWGFEPQRVIETNTRDFLYVGDHGYGGDLSMHIGGLTSTGDTLWSHDLEPGNKQKCLEAVYEFPGNRFIVAGKGMPTNIPVVALKLVDASGRVLNERDLAGNDGNWYATSVIFRTFNILPRRDKDLIVQSDLYTIRIDTMLNLKWTFGGTGYIRNYASCLDPQENPIVLIQGNLIEKIGMNYPPYFVVTPNQLRKSVFTCDTYRDSLPARDSFPNERLVWGILPSGSSTGPTIDSLAGVIQWRPLLEDTGQQTVRVTVRDRMNQFDTITYQVSILVNPNRIATKSPVVDTLYLGAKDSVLLSVSPLALECRSSAPDYIWLRNGVAVAGGSTQFMFRFDSAAGDAHQSAVSCIVSELGKKDTATWVMKEGQVTTAFLGLETVNRDAAKLKQGNIQSKVVVYDILGRRLQISRNRAQSGRERIGVYFMCLDKNGSRGNIGRRLAVSRNAVTPYIP